MKRIILALFIFIIANTCVGQISRDSMHVIFNNVNDAYINSLRERLKKTGLWGSSFSEVIPDFFDTIVPYKVFYAGVYQRYFIMMNVYTGEIIHKIDVKDVNRLFAGKTVKNIDKCYMFIMANYITGLSITPYSHYKKDVQKGSIFKKADEDNYIFAYNTYSPWKYIYMINKSTNDNIYMGVYVKYVDRIVYKLFNFKFIDGTMVDAQLVCENDNSKEIYHAYRNFDIDYSH